QIVDAGRLRPDPQDAVVVVGEHDAAAGLDRPDHRPDNRDRLRNVLEDESRVGDVEGPPFVAMQLQVENVAAAEGGETLLAFGGGKPVGAGELLFAALDPCHTPARDGASHRARELTEAGTEVEDAFVAAKGELSKRLAIEEDVIEQRQTTLFIFGRPVD